MFRFFFSSRRRHTRFDCDWSSDVCSSDLILKNENTYPPSLAHMYFRSSKFLTPGIGRYWPGTNRERLPQPSFLATLHSELSSIGGCVQSPGFRWILQTDSQFLPHVQRLSYC